MAETKSKIHIGRKFVAFILCLVALIVLGVTGKGSEVAPFIIALYASYVTGNVTQKATAKEVHNDEGVTDER